MSNLFSLTFLFFFCFPLKNKDLYLCIMKLMESNKKLNYFKKWGEYLQLVPVLPAF